MLIETIGISALGAACGVIAAHCMTGFMRVVSTKFSKRVDMILALGSYFTKSLRNAASVGRLIHSIAGIAYGIAYVLIMRAMGALVLPYSLFLGIGFGFFHGLIVSYMLMFYASERHPIEQYRKATLEEGLLHLVGHIIYGAVLGFLAGLIMSLAGS
ncbi:hypothetical protein [Coraliomargarita parva]|uniref:hypothetical protein n=1 Tax=Coraliomargarita parva TaxID=3014050 RepID=UPI0022B42DA4|nr:hypothetical protein [Coraliomargarita parva]